MAENKMTLLAVILCAGCAVFAGIGLRLLLAPETRRESFRKARATIVSRGSSRDGGFSPLLQFQDGGKTVRTYSALPVADGPECREGGELDILYCPKRILFIPTWSVIPDDNGKSLKRIGRFYRITGAGMLLAGCLFLVPIIFLLRK